MKGFTLVETLVAVAILTIAMVGPYSAAQHSLTAAIAARDGLIGSSLAQEGVEYVRSVRDSNYFLQRPWLTGLATCMPGPCVVDATDNTTSSSITPMTLDSTGLYSQRPVTVSNHATPFTRKVSVTVVPSSPAEVLVTVTVNWSTHSTPFSVTMREHLTGWQ